jgi:hypothetical protein
LVSISILRRVRDLFRTLPTAVVVFVTVTVAFTVEVLGLGVTVLVGPRKQLHAELILAVKGLPEPQFAPRTAGIAGGKRSLVIIAAGLGCPGGICDGGR